MKLVSTKITEAEKKERKARYDKPIVGIEEYPYSTRVCLDKRVLDKLGISPTEYKVGDSVKLEAVCSVKSLKQVDGKGYDTSEIELTMEKVGIEKKTNESLKDAISKGVEAATDD